MFIWPADVPSSDACPSELADYAELLCMQSGSLSVTELSQTLGRLEDNDYARGVDEYSPLDESLQLAMKEVERRITACNSGYPFLLDAHGTCITLAFSGTQSWLYAYLLLATRLNMQSNRVHAGIDGALLLEKVGADVLRTYFGTRSDSFVFGTAAADRNFQQRVQTLCQRLEEGQGFVNRNTGRPTAQDAKLDVVAWTPFADKRQGKLVVFGQCKTGRNWRDDMAQLQPEAFCKSWMRDPLAVTPLRLFLVAESVPDTLWYSQTATAGVIFDRCRLVDYGKDLSDEVLCDVKKWVHAAATARNATLPRLAAQFTASPHAPATTPTA